VPRHSAATPEVRTTADAVASMPLTVVPMPMPMREASRRTCVCVYSLGGLSMLQWMQLLLLHASLDDVQRLEEDRGEACAARPVV
jgi:hypothetical protein